MYKRCVRCDSEFRMLAINIVGRNEKAERAGRASRTGDCGTSETGGTSETSGTGREF